MHQRPRQLSQFDQLATWFSYTLKQHELAELGVGTFAIAYGFSFLVGPPAFASTPAFARLAAFTTEPVVGVVFLLVGFTVLYGSIQQRPLARVLGTMLLFLMLVFYAFMIWLASPVGRGWVTYGSLAVLTLLVFARNCSTAFPVWLRAWYERHV